MGLINGLISLIGVAITAVLSLLPNSPFNFVQNINSTWLTAINWIMPVASVVAHLELFVSAVIIYYGIRIVLRWVKAASA
jgi:hypothetical protein